MMKDLELFNCSFGKCVALELRNQRAPLKEVSAEAFDQLIVEEDPLLEEILEASRNEIRDKIWNLTAQIQEISCQTCPFR